MSTVQGTDEVLVNRNNETYTQPQSTLMANLEKTDLLLVNRSDETYTVSGEDFISSVVDPISLNVSINPSSPTIGQEVTAIPIVTGGKAPAGGFVYTYQWYIADDNSGTNATEIAGATTNKYTPLQTQDGKYLGCKVTTTDFFGDTIEDTTYAGPVTTVQIAPDIQSVALTEVYDGVNRYTSKSFPFTTTMAVDGTPDPDYKLKVKLTGATFNFDVKSDVIKDVDAAGTINVSTEAIRKVSAGAYLTGASYEASGATSNETEWLKAFDGNLATYIAAGAQGSYAKVTFNNPIPKGTKFEINGTQTVAAATAGSENGIIVNTTPVGDKGFSQSSTTGSWIDLTSDIPESTISSLTVRYDHLLCYGQIYAIRVDNVILKNTDVTLEFAQNTDFDKFAVDDLVQGTAGQADEAKIISIRSTATPPAMVVSGGNWYADLANNGDGSGTAGGDTEVSKALNYNAKVTLNSNQDLSTLLSKAVHMTETTNPGTKDGYTLTTSNITNISENPTPTINPDDFATYDPFRNPATYGTVTHYDGGGTVTFTFSPAWDMSGVKYYNGGCFAPGEGFTITLTYEDDTTFTATYNTVASYGSPFDIVAAGFDASKKVKSFSQTDNSSPSDYSGITGFYKADQTALKYPYASTLKELTFADPCPDLRYFEKDDVVQTSPAEVKVVDKNVANRTLTVDGGNWDNSNQSANWSSGWSGDFFTANTARLSFDGAEPTAPNVAGYTRVNGTLTWTKPAGSTTSFSKLEILGFVRNSGSTSQSMVINGVDVSSQFQAGVGGTWGWVEVTGVTGDLNTIVMKGDTSETTGIAAIKLDGKLLVDPVNDSQVWSNRSHTNIATSNNRKIQNAFDNLDTTKTGPELSNNNPGIINLNISFTNSFEIIADHNGGGSFIKINHAGGTYDAASLFGASASKQDLTSFVTSPITSIELSNNGATNASNLTAIYVDGARLVDQNISPIGDSNITYTTSGGEGTIVKVDGNDAYITNSGDRNSRWIADDNAASTEFYIAPQTPITDSKTTAYGVVAQVNGEINVTGIQKTEPAFVDITAKDGTIKFPAQFRGTGNPPDTDLPNGVSITATVFAGNTQGNDDRDSNTLLPQAPNPDGIVGPITASTETTITSVNTANIDDLTASDNLVMVDVTGALATYGLETTAISKVEDQSLNLSATAQKGAGWVVAGSPNNAIDGVYGDGNVTTYNAQGIRINLSEPVSGFFGHNASGGVANKQITITYYDESNQTVGSPFVFTRGSAVTRYNDPVKRENVKYFIGASTSTGQSSDGNGWTQHWYNDKPILAAGQTYATKKLTFSGALADNKDLKFFRINDTVATLDGGSWSGTAFDNGFPGTGAFDGKVKSAIDTCAVPETAGTATWNGSIDIPAGASVSMSYWNQADGKDTAVISINDTAVSLGYVARDSQDLLSVDITSQAGSEITKMAISRTQISGGGVGIAGIFIDGTGVTGSEYTSGAAVPVTVVSTGFTESPQTNTMVVSGGKWYADAANGGDGSGVSTGATEVTFTPPGGTATFDSAAGSVLTVSNSNNRWISNDNRLGTDFYLKKSLGRGLNADNPADVQIYQDIVDAFDAFPVKVNQRRTGIASSLYRLMSGEAVSAAELSVLEDTVLDAVNAQEPFALDGYYPLYYTSDKADAASSAGTHHVHTIDGIEYYMPDGGTLYHGNYTS